MSRLGVGYGKSSLRCEPALTEEIDAMEHPPGDRIQAERAALCWKGIERSLWPEHQSRRSPNWRAMAVSKITPEYILATVRTKKFREAEAEAQGDSG